jgi:hypothetical protein
MYFDVKVRLSNKFWAGHLLDCRNAVEGATAHRLGPLSKIPIRSASLMERTMN